MIPRLAVALGLGALALSAAACGSSSSGGSSPVTHASSGPNANGCTTPPALQKVHQTYKAAPKLTIARATYTARIVTNCGTIIASLDGKHAPQTVNSFAFLASKGYFTDTPCHRLTSSGIYVLQCGDPTGTGSGGPGYTLPDENLKGATYPAGTLAMANSNAPHTGGSQFFFVYADTPPGDLAASYTPFGKVTSGLNVLTNIAKAGSTPAGDGKPNQPVVIESFSVTKA